MLFNPTTKSYYDTMSGEEVIPCFECGNESGSTWDNDCFVCNPTTPKNKALSKLYKRLGASKYWEWAAKHKVDHD